MPWFVKIERGIVAKSIFDQYVPAHRAFVEALIAEGRAARTGYWADSRGGMLIFRAESMAEAQAIVAQDPLIVNQCVEYELHQWVPVVGTDL
ncbi:hypothetical protein GS597_01015 [Synechococcales cyanobacterium C]|uniref:YCII-related domain-containing protein n=1 Tax=Petrachloros mirabilis ULC683 TaxID=2781853 RepID=A0A8K2AGR2_9CYAN|nr:YciI family protein [Petrachloros mirabilis]NCJ05119.1 hypothetical protein [Petrachloros mirabilis ULC683]